MSNSQMNEGKTSYERKPDGVKQLKAWEGAKQPCVISLLIAKNDA